MPGKNKDRLFLTLNHRHNQPGYHWSILLAPIDEPQDPGFKNAICWDITNEGLGPLTWRFRERAVNQYSSVSLIARILLAKFEVDQRGSIAQTLRDLFAAQEIRNNDPSFTCRVWVLNCIASLAEQGIIRLKVHDTGTLEEMARAFGDEVMGRIQRREIDIAEEGVSAIPILDLRK